MATLKVSCLRGEVAIQTPDSVEEYDLLAGRQGAALEAAIRQTVYHKTLGDVREDIVEAAEKAFEFPRAEIDTGKKRKSDGTPILADEDADTYARRLFAAKGWSWEEPPTEWQTFVSTIPVTFDPSATVRTRTAKTLAAVYVKAVEQIYSAGSQAKAAKALGVALTGDEAGDRALLGWAIKAREDAKRREQEARMLEGLK